MATIVVAMYQPSNNQQGLELGQSQTDLSHFSTTKSPQEFTGTGQQLADKLTIKVDPF